MKKVLLTLLSIFLVMNVVPAHANEADNDRRNDFNPYVNQYILEYGLVTDSMPRDQVYLVDPKVEENIIIETLNYYYEEDKKVAAILTDILKDSLILEKTLSLVKEDKIDVMHSIIKNYSSIADLNDKEALLDYLERYAHGTGDVEAVSFIKDQYNQIIDDHSVLLSTGYNKTAAANWAYNYDKYSTDYPNFSEMGTDCTNFVSQAMHVGGGMAMQGDWYVRKKNSTYLIPKNTTELDYSWDLSDPSPWISVRQFDKFWSPKSTVVSATKAHYKSFHESTYYPLGIYKGDVVVFYKGIAGFILTATHLMIISDYDTTNKDYKLAGHTNDRQALPLLEAIESYSEIKFILLP